MAVLNAEQRLNADLDNLKNPENYKDYGTVEVANIQQAIDILHRLRQDISNSKIGRSRVGFEKLTGAIDYLEDQMREQVNEQPKE